MQIISLNSGDGEKVNILENLIERYPALSVCRNDIQIMYQKIADSFENGGRLYICGNGGSASDALHIVGELAKSFVLKRPLDAEFLKKAPPEICLKLQGALPAIALVENAALTTAYANDVDPAYIFAQQVYAYARKGDCVLGISTSGNSVNVLNALKTASARNACTLGLTGRGGGKMKFLCDACVVVPETETYRIQELHLPVYHALCMMLEEHFWGSR